MLGLVRYSVLVPSERSSKRYRGCRGLLKTFDLRMIDDRLVTIDCRPPSEDERLEAACGVSPRSLSGPEFREYISIPCSVCPLHANTKLIVHPGFVLMSGSLNTMNQCPPIRAPLHLKQQNAVC